MSKLLYRFARHLFSYAAIIVVVILTIMAWTYAGITSREQVVVSSALSHGYCMIIVCDAKGQVLYANSKLTELTGYSLLELQAGGLSLIIPPELEQAHAVAYAKAMIEPKYDRETPSIAVELCCKDGHRVPGVMKISIVKTNAGPAAYSFFIPSTTLQSACDTVGLGSCKPAAATPIAKDKGL
jgi:PAS domain S-box-containing protein